MMLDFETFCAIVDALKPIRAEIIDSESRRLDVSHATACELMMKGALLSAGLDGLPNDTVNQAMKIFLDVHTEWNAFSAAIHEWSTAHPELPEPGSLRDDDPLTTAIYDMKKFDDDVQSALARLSRETPEGWLEEDWDGGSAGRAADDPVALVAALRAGLFD